MKRLSSLVNRPLFVLDPAKVTGKPIVLLSGGIGFTPVLSMLKCLFHQRIQTPVYFIHGARNSRVHALAGEVRHLASESANLHIHFRYDTPLPSNDAEFYFCGPKPFMAGLRRGLKDWGVEDDRIHFEFFGPQQELTTIGARV